MLAVLLLQQKYPWWWKKVRMPRIQTYHLVHFVVPGDQATVSIPFTLVPREQSVALLENAVLGLLTLCNFLLKPLRPSCNMPSICVLFSCEQNKIIRISVVGDYAIKYITSVAAFMIISCSMVSAFATKSGVWSTRLNLFNVFQLMEKQNKIK